MNDDVVIVAGIDPGLVHTGVVALAISRSHGSVQTIDCVVDGPDSVEVERQMGKWALWPCNIYVEKYRPRTHLSSDERMIRANHEFGGLLNASLLLNYGVKKVVTKELMEFFHVWKFDTPTHHQDLRSAARILLLGMLKNDEHNALLTEILTSGLAGSGRWSIY